MRKLAERLFLVDPYNDKHMEMIVSFERKHGLSEDYSKALGKIRASLSKEEYLQNRKKNNEIEEDLFIEKDSKIVDYCHIHGEKDIKTGRISPASLKELERKRKIISLATDYALTDLGLEEVFVEINPNHKGFMTYLENKGYENLGEENGKVIYLKEKEEEKRNQRMIA